MGYLMKDDNKTKKQLVHELTELRSQCSAEKIRKAQRIPESGGKTSEMSYMIGQSGCGPLYQSSYQGYAGIRLG